MCRGTYPGVGVPCFAPDPSTTLGGARQIRAPAQARGWTSTVVVTGIHHVSRARWIITGCSDGRITVTAPADRPGVLGWAHQYVYPSAGYAKAVLISGC